MTSTCNKNVPLFKPSLNYAVSPKLLLLYCSIVHRTVKT